MSEAELEITDDIIFRRKLLLDGGGLGDARRIDYLLKAFHCWCDAKAETEEEMNAACDKITVQLENLKLLAAKSYQTRQANTNEIEDYEKIHSTIEEKISEVKKHIIRKKEDLIAAKEVRKNKLQYDALAKIINELPDREETQMKIKKLDIENELLAKKKEDLEKELAMRQKQLRGLLTVARDVKEKFRSEEEQDSESD